MEKVLRGLDWILDRMTLILVAVLLLVVGLQIFFRYVLNHSLFWSEELARYLFVYLVFLGAAIILRKERHIQVSFFVERLAPPVQKCVALFVDLILLAFAGVVLWQSIKLALVVWTVLTAALLIPWTFVYLGILLSMAAMVLVILGRSWLHLTGANEGDR
jgi:TRAP-type C4-dicarboxylate transport system permease small subunit